ncbi:hypothetical protein KC318_g25 [Hortaea werneckii]|nr:hypothetical protein KC355_g26 [Hortaea werneckii]KAI7676759.1 hypothetical protein KC318_g25 [Hortaea werneckii]
MQGHFNSSALFSLPLLSMNSSSDGLSCVYPPCLWNLDSLLWAIAYGNDGLPENAYYRWPAEYLRIRTNLHHSGRITERVYSAIKTHALVLAAELSIFGGGSHGLHVTELAVPRAASQRTVFSPAALDLQQSIEAYDPRLRTHVPDEGRVHRTLLAL